MKTLVVIPAYNEESRVGRVVGECLAHTPHVLVVDDGSTDATAAEARRSGARVLSNEGNRGKGFSLRRGFDLAIEQGFDAVVTLDADGQHDPACIPGLVDMIERGHDAVIGTRKKTGSVMPYHRRASNFFLSLVFSALSRAWIRDSQSGFRAFRVSVLRDLDLRSTGFETESEILMKLGRRGVRFAEVPIPVIYGDERSHINVARDLVRFVRVLGYRK
jgi:glycosyltransferase involved in cell wall biosynthesis